MRFRASPNDDTPDINLIPLIDVLLVMLIFLAATTTFMRQNAIKVVLPRAESEALTQNVVEIAIAEDGRYAIAGQTVSGTDPHALTKVLQSLLQGKEDPGVIISADAMATHQSVIHAMQAAKQAGISRIQFATQAGN